MLTSLILLIVGLGLLLVAGDLLVRGAVGLTNALGIPALVVGLTVVAFGTSAPELVVTIQAVTKDAAGLALGNIIGSNIANILMVLGAPAVIYPISAHVPGLNRHAVIMLVASAAFAALAYGPGEISFTSGAILFAAIVAYVGYMGLRAKQGIEEPGVDEIEEFGADRGLSARTIAFLVIGLIGLPVGANLLVTNGAALASGLGVRDEIIGLTVVAFGTSLPELATVAAAAVHKKSDVAIGNIVGSNIFNLLAVGGAAGLAGGAVFDANTLLVDLPVMLAVAALIAAFIFTKRDIGRIAGLAFTAAYIGFIAYLAMTSGVA